MTGLDATLVLAGRRGIVFVFLRVTPAVVSRGPRFRADLDSGPGFHRDDIHSPE